MMVTDLDPYEDRCTVRVRAYLRHNGLQGRIDGPLTCGLNCHRERGVRRREHDDFQLVGVYDMTGAYIPHFPCDLTGQEGIDGWFRRMEQDGFTVTSLVEFRR